MSVSSKRAHQLGLRLVLLADDADHLVEVEVGDEVAVEDLEPPLDRGEPVPRAADQTTSRRWSSQARSASREAEDHRHLAARRARSC